MALISAKPAERPGSTPITSGECVTGLPFAKSQCRRTHSKNGWTMNQYSERSFSCSSDTGSSQGDRNRVDTQRTRKGSDVGRLDAATVRPVADGLKRDFHTLSGQGSMNIGSSEALGLKLRADQIRERRHKLPPAQSLLDYASKGNHESRDVVRCLGMSVDNQKLGKRLKASRKRSKLRQVDIAAVLEMTPQAVSLIEKGRVQTTLERLERYATHVDLELVVELFDPADKRERLASDIVRILPHLEPKVLDTLAALVDLWKADLERSTVYDG